MTDRYTDVRAKLSEAGFYATSTENMGRWDRITTCSEGPPKSKRYGGRSFWIACVGNNWYVGTWGSFIYQLEKADSLLTLSRAFLNDTGCISDFSPELKHEFGLYLLSDEEVERLLPDDRPEQ